MKILFILSAVLCALASDRNQHQTSGWIRQNIRSNNYISSSSSSSESDEQLVNILKTKTYNPKRCILVPEPTSDELHEFHQWAALHSKQYSSEREQSCRMINVIYKLRDIHAHNKRFDEGKETFKRALNHLSDLTRKEIKAQILMEDVFNWNRPRDSLENLKEFPEAREAVDYRDENYVGQVGQQGKCGSCWAWSSAAVLEGQLRKCGISEEPVSVQNMVDCVTKFCRGCKGGIPYEAFAYEKTGGILTAAKYPYFGKQRRCSFNRSDIIGYVDQPFEYFFPEIPAAEAYMRKIVSSVGPISTVLYANDNFEDYATGVFTATDCNRKAPNHAVTIVGYGTDPKFGDYWLLKNSWGTTWGENGFGKIARGKNMCRFESRVFFAQIADKNRNVCSFE
ncbi:hypothetical protein ACKWTF_014927 [Chironomus riparius]